MSLIFVHNDKIFAEALAIGSVQYNDGFNATLSI